MWHVGQAATNPVPRAEQEHLTRDGHQGYEAIAWTEYHSVEP